MIYYTTKEQEDIITKPYLEAVKIKNKEIKDKEKKTGQIQKYTSQVFIKTPNRTFISNGSEMFIRIEGIDYLCPNQLEEGGGEYRIDPDFTENLKKFVESNPKYIISFDIDGKYGKCIYYYAPPNVYPSKISNIENENIFEYLEDEDKYDIGCL